MCGLRSLWAQVGNCDRPKGRTGSSGPHRRARRHSHGLLDPAMLMLRPCRSGQVPRQESLGGGVEGRAVLREPEEMVALFSKSRSSGSAPPARIASSRAPACPLGTLASLVP